MKKTNEMMNGWALNLQKNHGQKALDKAGLKEFKKDPENFNYGKYIMPESLLREYADQVYWYGVVDTQNLSESFLREMKKHFKKYEWQMITKHFFNFSDAFLKDFAKKLDWSEMNYSKLSEEQIEKFANYVDWNTLSRTTKVSKNFAKKFVNEINWTRYYMHNVDFCFQGCFSVTSTKGVDIVAKKYKELFN